jgi:hypothetical protein
MRSALVTSFVTAVLASQAAYSQADTAAEIALLKAEIAGLLARIERLEQARPVPVASAPAPATPAAATILTARASASIARSSRGAPPSLCRSRAASAESVFSAR